MTLPRIQPRGAPSFAPNDLPIRSSSSREFYAEIVHTAFLPALFSGTNSDLPITLLSVSALNSSGVGSATVSVIAALNCTFSGSKD